MTQFYLRPRNETLAQKLAPKLPAGFFTPKKKEEKETKKN
jgi:hypothetical protein